MSLKPRPVDFNQTWAGIRSTIEGVVTLSKVNRSEWNDRFSDVYSLCVAHPEPYTNQLYTETKVFLRDHVKLRLEEIERETDQSNYLKLYHEMWTKFSQGVDFLNKLYSYLNQQHIKKSKLSDADIMYGGYCDAPSGRMIEIGELGLDLWRSEMLEKVQQKLVNLIIEAIRQDRFGSTSNSTTIVSGVIASFVAVEDAKLKNFTDNTSTLTFYEKYFEGPFLRDTAHYYHQEANKLIAACNVSEYMDKVIHKLHEEDMRARRYLHPSSYPKVSSECHRCLVADHIAMLHGECQNMVETDKRRDLADMYCLLKPLPQPLSYLAETFENFVKKVGLQAIENLKPETAHFDFVENIIVVYKKFKDTVNSVFNSDQMFLSALDKACTSVINYKPIGGKGFCRSPELLAKYCDALLKKSTKGFTETEVDEKLSQSIIIFKYIDDKDIFQKFYARNLAKRLIHQLSHSMDSEEGMINRLKAACGYEFTNKLHRMFTDVSVSQDLCQKFSNYLTSSNINLKINFGMLVLQAGAWPLQQSTSPFAVPLPLEKAVSSFETFYGKQFSGRKLTWLHHLSTGDVKVGKYLSNKKSYVITMQTFQMAILLQFETMDSYTLKELSEATQLNEDQLNRHISSLIECKLLEVSDGEQDFTPETVVSLNKEYANKRTKFRISGAVQKETPQEVEQTHVSVDEDRKIFMQAAIVRIMKSRKVIKHNVLIQEVLSLSDGRFCPTISVIKKCIETLIERQYLERMPNSTDEYSYIA